VRGGGIDSRNYYADQRIGSGDLVYNLGLRVTIPITTQAAELRLSRAGTEMERARLEVQAAIEAAEREVLQRRAALRRELDRRTLTERLLSVSRQKLEIDRQRLQLGRGTALQFRLSEEEFVRARGQLTADRARVLIAWIDLLNASSSFQLPR
jgi:outer membrane protein TolC